MQSHFTKTNKTTTKKKIMQQGGSHKLKATISILHHRPGRLCSTVPRHCPASLPQLQCTQSNNTWSWDHFCLLNAWPQLLGDIRWSLSWQAASRSKPISFALSQLNQLFLATNTSKSGISQLLSEIINANHLWFVCIRVHSPSYTRGSTDAFKLSIHILTVSNCLRNLW